jgi:Ca2+-binding EF-hand superfamily protein
MNKERDSAIAEDELRFYLQHWGLNLTDEQFNIIFKMFDQDGDGMISFNDFH